MKTPEFNLLEEAWIRVLKDDCSEEMVSLPEAMIHAHEYRDLCGDTPEQDMAVLRLLLAVLHTIFSKMDEDGQDNVIDTPTQARKRWRALWEKGYFKEDVIRTYLEKYHERFWLFHDQYPFWQIPEAAVGTEYTVAKLNGSFLKVETRYVFFHCVMGSKSRKWNMQQQPDGFYM